MKDQQYLKDVTTLKLDTDKCIGCGMCEAVCPHRVFEVKDRKSAIIDKDACMECGACSRNCPVEAISVREGVGCAYAIIMSSLKGSKAVCCGPTDKSDKSCCT